MSDKEGNLIFFSGGCDIRNRDLQIMENGEAINDGQVFEDYCSHRDDYPMYQGIFALPKTETKYDIFNLSQNYDSVQTCWTDRLLHAEVDMSYNQGLGKVTRRNEVVATGCFQEACANRHANGRDWWLLLPDNREGKFSRFLVRSDTILGPWEQAIANPSIVDSIQPGFSYFGWSEFSPDGNKFLINFAWLGVAVYDFDRCTGLLSNPRLIPRGPHLNWASVFSPDSRFIYVEMNWSKRIDQFDLQAPDLLASRTTVLEWDGFYEALHNKPAVFTYMQHGPDGKIYIWGGDTRYLHVINYPNRKGLACEGKQRAIALPSWAFSANHYYPNYRLGPIDGSGCDTLGIDNEPVALFRHDFPDSTHALLTQFTDLSYFEPTAWHWDFGDGTTSQDTSPMHIFPAPGLYHVCLTVSNQYASDTICKDVLVQQPVIGTRNPGESDGRVLVFPNPADGFFQVVYELDAPGASFQLFDATGRPVRAAALDARAGNRIFDAASLADGLYFWTIRERGNGAVRAGRLLIVR